MTMPTLFGEQPRTNMICRASMICEPFYACDRYAQLTGCPAPAVAGCRQANKAVDRSARQILSQELGHGRADVVAAYVGSAC